MFDVIARYLDGAREFKAATFDDESAAREYALRANCKAFTPLYFYVKGN
jgi:hypothetical protein